MRIAAGIVGILVGIASISYIGLIGGIVGSVTSWLGSGPWVRGGSGGSGLGQMITVLSYLSGLLAIVGGIVAFSNARIGGVILAVSALSHWYLLGFGIIGNIFILPIAVAAAFAFFAARSGLAVAAPAISPRPTSTQTMGSASNARVPPTSPLIDTAPAYDAAKWDALLKYDSEVAASAERVRPFGQKWLNELASSYLALNDKQYLASIEEKIVAAAESELNDAEVRKLEEQKKLEIYLQEQRRLADQRSEQVRLDQQRRREFFTVWVNRFWGNSVRRAITIGSAALVAAVLVGVYLSFQAQREREQLEVARVEGERQAALARAEKERQDALARLAAEKPLTIRTRSGSIRVKDFLNNGITIPDPSNAGYYFLAGGRPYPCSAEKPECRIGPPGKFSITYISSTNFFNIWIGEPLAQSRKAAQEFLMKTLGATTSEMCGLSYSLGTTVYDDYDYAGRDIPFSFCPGSISLPSKPSNRRAQPRVG